MLFLYYEESVYPLILKYNKVYFVSSLITKPNVHEGGKVGRSNATPPKLFFVNSYDLKFVWFKFINDIFITFEMPRVSYIRSKPRKSNSFYSVHL